MNKQAVVDELKTDIINFLEKETQPRSTQDIAETLSRPWHSIQTRCLTLQLDGKLNGFRVGRVNLWQIKK